MGDENQGDVQIGEVSTAEQESTDASPMADAGATSVPSATPPTQIREDLVATAVKFLQNPKVQQRPFDQRQTFLERKGMNKAEIELAILRSGTDRSIALPVASSRGGQTDLMPPPHHGPMVVPMPVAQLPSSWTRLRDMANLIVLLTGAGYAIYHLYKRFIVPALYGSTAGKPDPLGEVQQSVDELRRSMNEIVAGITETQSLIRTQQRQMDDVIRLNSLQRGPEEMGRMHVSEVKDELKSLKALLLNRKQFPSLPSTAPVIPTWQLQPQNLAEKPATSTEIDGDESRADDETVGAETAEYENWPVTESPLIIDPTVESVVKHDVLETVAEQLEEAPVEKMEPEPFQVSGLSETNTTAGDQSLGGAVANGHLAVDSADC